MSDEDATSFLSAMEDVRKKTRRQERSRKEIWKQLREEWITHYNDEIPNAIIEKRTELLIAVRFTEFFQTLCWVEWLSLSGGYYSAIRDLRSILEAVIQAYYIDLKYPHIDVQGKLAVLKEMLEIGGRQSYGRGLITRANPPDLKNIAELYGKLSGYIHPTIDQMNRILASADIETRIIELMLPTYDHELFEQCCQLSEQVVSHIINIHRHFISRLQSEQDVPEAIPSGITVD